MDGGAWWAAVHGVAKSQIRLSDFTFTFHFHALEKEMATHSSVLAENPRDGGAWWAAICGVAQSQTRLKRRSSKASSPPGFWCPAFSPSQESCIFQLIFNGVQLLYNVVLDSAKQQSESAIHIHISTPFWTSFPFGPPQSIKQSPCAKQYVLVSYLFHT